jgi:hypothetical protein
MGIAALFYVDLALAIGATIGLTKLCEWLIGLRGGNDGGGGEWRRQPTRPHPPHGDSGRTRAPRLPEGPRRHPTRLPR